MKDAMFAMQIIYNELYVDENDKVQSRVRTLVLDAVSDPQATYSNTVTEHPIVSGDMVSDHSYKNPMNLSFSGSAALKGHNGAVIDGTKITPANLQNTFKQIKDNAYLCEIVKISVTNEDDIRFARYSNMTLMSITITEKINTIDYSLSWKQVMLAKVQEIDVDLGDEFLPSVTEPKTTSFTDALIDWAQVDKALVEQLISFELIASELLDYMKSLTYAAFTALALGIAAGLTIATVASSAAVAALASTLGISVSAGPVGWVVAAVVVVVVFVIGLIKAISRLFKRQRYKIQAFKHYQTDRENDKEVERFCNFIGSVHQQLESLNNVIHAYQISSDDDQECIVSISNNYYIFTFTTNNTSGNKKTKMCTVTDIKNQIRATVQDVSTCPSNYNACNTDNYLFRADESGSYVYIIVPPVEGAFKLSNCFVVVSDINPEDYDSALSDIIRNAITY